MKIVDTLQLARHVPGDRKNRRMVATCLIKAGDEMVLPGPVDPQHTPSRPVALLGPRRERCPFLVADADPFDFALAHDVADRIKRIGDETEYVLDANLFERVDQSAGHCL